MNYDDFSLLDDYGQIAKAYFENMKNKGYAFVRLDDVNQKKMQQVQKVADLLFDRVGAYNKIKPYLKDAQIQFWQQLCSLSISQCESIKRLYNIVPQTLAKKQDLGKLVSAEAKILSELFELLFMEQDENFAIIKNMIFERLQILKQQ